MHMLDNIVDIKRLKIFITRLMVRNAYSHNFAIRIVYMLEWCIFFYWVPVFP